MKFKLLTAAVVLAMAGTANASIVTPATGNSALIFTAWDTTLPSVGFVRDLGVTFNDYAPTSGVLASGFTQTFAADPEFALTFAGSNMANIVWNVAAADGKEAAGTDAAGRNLLTTGLLNGGGPLTQPTTGINSALTNFITTMDRVNADPTGCATNTSCDTTRVGDELLWVDSFGSTIAMSNAAVIGDSLGFYSIVPGTTNRSPGTFTAYQNTDGFATWTFGADGSLVYQSAAAAAVVPVPAAIWLMGSALIGLLGVARRQNSETNVVAA